MASFMQIGDSPGLHTAIPAAASGPAIAGVPVEFVLFGLMLLGVALFHHHTLKVALSGLAGITLYKLVWTGFDAGRGLPGLADHFRGEWVLFANLFCLLMGFTILARHFEKSHVPVLLPKLLPDDWKGAFLLLLMVFVLSAFLDNIAAAVIGGAMAHQLFRARVHIGYLAAIVAAANAGGAGSVVGDTTTTMMWISGVSPAAVLDAYIASAVAFLAFAVVASRQQQAFSPILKHAHAHTHPDRARLLIIGTILSFAVVTNVTVNLRFPASADRFPFVGSAVWLGIAVTAGIRRHDWEALPESFKGSLFLLSLVACASLMPVERLPAASWRTTFGLGFLSSVFDNIPLTELALKQGGYDWGLLAYAVGYGGSMVWFGSSAGVALSSLYPESRSVGSWLRNGWHVTVAYVAGFLALLLILGWKPTPIRAPGGETTAVVAQESA